eukprot:6070458-Pyramimonas_sp.AAC.1
MQEEWAYSHNGPIGHDRARSRTGSWRVVAPRSTGTTTCCSASASPSSRPLPRGGMGGVAFLGATVKMIVL